MNFSIFALFLLAIVPTSNGIISGWIGPYKPMLNEQDSDEFSQEDQPKIELIETGRADRPDSFFLLDTVVESGDGNGKKVDKNALAEAEDGQAEEIAEELVAVDKIVIESKVSFQNNFLVYFLIFKSTKLIQIMGKHITHICRYKKFNIVIFQKFLDKKSNFFIFFD